MSEDLNLIRTDLANERTLLSYGRTALMVAGTGFTLLKFFDEGKFNWIMGWTLIATSLVLGIIGIVRFIRLNRRLRVNSLPID